MSIFGLIFSGWQDDFAETIKIYCMLSFMEKLSIIEDDDIDSKYVPIMGG